MAKKKRLSRAERAAKLKAAQENAAGLFSGKGAVEPPQKDDPKPVSEPKPKQAAPAKAEPQTEAPAEKSADSSPAAKEETIDLSDSQIVSGSAVLDDPDPAPVPSAPSSSESLLDDILGSSPPPASDSSATRQETPAAREQKEPEAQTTDSSATRQETPAARPPAPKPEEQFFSEPLGPVTAEPKAPEARQSEPEAVQSTKAEPVAKAVYVKTEVETLEEEAKDGKPATVKDGDITALRSGVSVKYERSMAGKKILTVIDSGKNELANVIIAPSQTKEVEVPSKDGPLKLTFEYKDADGVYCAIDGGKTTTAHALDKATAVGRFLGNVRYYLPELTMAGLFAAATSAIAWTSPYLANGLQGWHKVAVAAYAVVQLGLTTWSFLEKRNQRKELNIAEAAQQE